MKTPKNTVRAALVAAFPHTIPILAGFLFLGMTYGIYMRTLGAICGSLLHFNTEGLDFVMTAMFVVIFMDQWLKEKNHTSSLLGLGISFLCLLVFGPDSFMIPTMILIIVSLTLLRKKLDIPDQKNYSRHHFDKCASEKMK